MASPPCKAPRVYMRRKAVECALVRAASRLVGAPGEHPLARRSSAWHCHEWPRGPHECWGHRHTPNRRHPTGATRPYRPVVPRLRHGRARSPECGRFSRLPTAVPRVLCPRHARLHRRALASTSLPSQNCSSTHRIATRWHYHPGRRGYGAAGCPPSPRHPPARPR